MKIRYLIVTIFFITLASTALISSANVSECVSRSDADYRNMIVGRWQFKDATDGFSEREDYIPFSEKDDDYFEYFDITYFNNGTYKYVTYYKDYFGNVHSKEGGDGKYFIKNGILYEKVSDPVDTLPQVYSSKINCMSENELDVNVYYDQPYMLHNIYKKFD